MKIFLESLTQMREFARALAAHLRGGDLLILSGNLGAGKTTFTQSLGKALGVAGRITSPTFVIAREHLSTGDGPALVHVDAYRLSDAAELEDLDLDSQLEESITVVEWGAGLAEQLSTDHLDITISPVFDLRASGSIEVDHVGAATELDDTGRVSDAEADGPDPEEERRVWLSANGPSWEARLPAVLESVQALGLKSEGPIGEGSRSEDLRSSGPINQGPRSEEGTP